MLVSQQLSHGLLVAEQGWVGDALPALGRRGERKSLCNVIVAQCVGISKIRTVQ